MPEIIELEFPDDKTRLDQLLGDEFGDLPKGLVEKTLEVNPGLARLGLLPPKGTRIKVELPAGFRRTADGGWESSG